MLVGPGHRPRTERPRHVDVDWHTPAAPLDAHRPHDDDEDGGEDGTDGRAGALRQHLMLAGPGHRPETTRPLAQEPVLRQTPRSPRDTHAMLAVAAVGTAERPVKM
jgi:hypothetical protein